MSINVNANPPTELVDRGFYPWRRFLARSFDQMLYTTIWLSFLTLCFRINLADISGFASLAISIVALLTMLFIEPLLLHWFGNTFGKLIFGLHLAEKNGKRPDYRTGLSRTWYVIVYGLGINIPLLSLYRLWKSYKLYVDEQPLPWDYDLVYTIRDTKWYRTVAFIGANVLLAGILPFTFLLNRVPPNHGALTIAEFAENYNLLARAYGAEGFYYLDANGKWSVNSGDGVMINIIDTPLPDFDYTVIDDEITGLRLDINVKGYEQLIETLNTQMCLAALAFAGAQEEVGIFSGVRDELVNEINAHPFEDFSVSKAGVEINCAVEYAGYENIPGMGMLIPQTGSQTSFSMVFNMVKGKANLVDTQMTSRETTENIPATTEQKVIVNSLDYRGNQLGSYVMPKPGEVFILPEVRMALDDLNNADKYFFVQIYVIPAEQYAYVYDNYIYNGRTIAEWSILLDLSYEAYPYSEYNGDHGGNVTIEEWKQKQIEAKKLSPQENFDAATAQYNSIVQPIIAEARTTCMQSECDRLKQLGYDVSLRQTWDYINASEKRYQTILTGLLTRKQLVEFSANAEFGYSVEWVHNGDGIVNWND